MLSYIIYILSRHVTDVSRHIIYKDANILIWGQKVALKHNRLIVFLIIKIKAMPMPNAIIFIIQV